MVLGVDMAHQSIQNVFFQRRILKWDGGSTVCGCCALIFDMTSIKDVLQSQPGRLRGSRGRPESCFDWSTCLVVSWSLYVWQGSLREALRVLPTVLWSAPALRVSKLDVTCR